MPMHRRIFISFVTVMAVMLVLSMSALASSFTVSNPGPIKLKVQAGSSMSINSHSFKFTKSATFKGAIDQNGNIKIPKSNLKFPTLSFNTQYGTVYIKIVGLANGTGNLDPSSGAMTLSVSLAANISGNTFPPIPNGCTISPIKFSLTTGTSGKLTGTPYNQGTSNASLVDGLFAVPSSSHCGSLWGPGINSQFGLPSSSGSNGATLNIHITPTIK